MLRRIVKSHAWSFVPGSKRSGYCKARRSVSWTRSSAASRWPVSDMAKARRCGVADSRPARKSASVAERVGHRLLLGEHIIKVGQDLEVGSETRDRETLLEGRPSDLLRTLPLACCIQGLKVGVLPFGPGTFVSWIVEVIV